jgi:hypothetical protein
MEPLVVIVIVFIIAIIFLNMNGNGTNQGYSSVNHPQNSDYYLWRAYGHDPVNSCKLNKHPYNYKPHPHPKRTNYYNPHFYNHGYGHL